MPEALEFYDLQEQRRAKLRGDAGYIHSHTTGSALDGPGMRYVLWTTGCAFRCQYCHNPDTWHKHNGELHSLDQVLADIGKYQRFLKMTKGGVTVSGGEPLIQSKFVMNILRGCKAMGLHTALDTNGFFGERISDEDLEAVDLVLLDIKSWDPATHLRVTGCEVEPVLQFAQRLAALGKAAWVRFVLVPKLTDDDANVAGLAQFVAQLPNVERLEILPFHQMGAYKWKERGMDYPLEGVESPSPELVAHVQQIFRDHGCKVW